MRGRREGEMMDEGEGTPNESQSDMVELCCESIEVRASQGRAGCNRGGRPEDVRLYVDTMHSI